MAKRSQVDLYEQIRKARRDEPGVSIRELARRFRTHRRYVREALESAVPPPRKVAERASPVLGEWKPVIDAWLEGDREVPRKQRHTARRVWQRLVEEHGAVVGESNGSALRRRLESDAALGGDRGDGPAASSPRR